jgi:hypothetical protein
MGAGLAAVPGGPAWRTTADDLPGGERGLLPTAGELSVAMLSRNFPSCSTVYGYSPAWIAAEVWALSPDPGTGGGHESPSAAIIDSQSVEIGSEAPEMVGYDAAKRSRAASGIWSPARSA